MASTNRWLVALACAWVNLFIFAVFRSGGVLYLSILDTFRCTYQQAAWSVSISGSVASITGLAAGFLAHYFRIRWLVLCGVLCCGLSLIVTFWADSIHFVTVTVGLCQGIGMGLVTNLLPAVLNAHFVEKKAIALGISYAGATLGAFIFPVVIQSLLTEFAFHSTMLLLGGLSLNAIAGALLLRKPDESSEPSNTNTDQHKPTNGAQQYTLQPLIGECETIVYVDNNQLYDNITQDSGPKAINTSATTQTQPSFASTLWTHLRNDLALLTNFHFVICTLTYISFILDFVAFIIILPDVAQDQGIAKDDSKWLLSVFSITDFVGRIGPGWLSYWNVVTDKTTYVVSITIMGVCMALLVTVQSYGHFVVVSLLCGLVTGAQMVLSPAILADYLGTENTAIAFGMANFVCGLFTLVTRPLIIGVKDTYGNYNLLGYLLSGTALFSGFLWVCEILFTSFRR